MYPLSSDLRPLVLCEHRIEALTNEAMHCDPVLGGQDFELLPNIGLDVNGDRNRSTPTGRAAGLRFRRHSCAESGFLNRSGNGRKVRFRHFLTLPATVLAVRALPPTTERRVAPPQPLVRGADTR